MDIDNIIKALDCHLDLNSTCANCPYEESTLCLEMLIADCKAALMEVKKNDMD